MPIQLCNRIKRVFLFLILFINCVDVKAVALYGHRGARGLSPENTLPAYQQALKIGVDYVDMDVVMTKDHILVVYHDLTLNPDITRNAEGKWVNNIIKVKDLTLSELRRYDVGRIKPKTIYAKLFNQQKAVDGTFIPTLKEVIHLVKTQSGNKVGFQIEIKTDPVHPALAFPSQQIALALAKIIEEEDIIDRTQVQAFDWRCLIALQKINPRIITAYLTDPSQEKMMHHINPKIAGLMTDGKLLKNYHYSIPSMIHALGGTLWDPQDREINATQIKEAHQLGLKVIIWSYPEESGKVVDLVKLKQLIKMGVDGIITDRPDIVKKLIS